MLSGICRGPIRRREFLRVGTLALGGIGLSDVLRERARAGEASRATSAMGVAFRRSMCHFWSFSGRTI